MSSVECPNCGSTKIVEVDGVPTCLSCGSKLPDISLGEFGDIDHDIREAEIIRLYNAKTPSEREPRMNILSDDEILKYAPNSKAARKIKTKRAGSFKEVVQINKSYLLAIILVFCIVDFYIMFSFISFEYYDFARLFFLFFFIGPILIYLYFR
ncbi:MAG: hypothetical protein ACI4VU_00125 [Methanobrevibacter sp.]